MPTYEYRCRECEHEFEKVQRITAPRGAVCPECDYEDCQRLMSKTSFVLRGTGWHVTDYKGRGSTEEDKK